MSVIRTGLVVYLLRQTPLKRAKLSGLDLSGLLAFDDGLVANADDQHVQAANGHHDDGAELEIFESTMPPVKQPIIRAMK